jgi:hypothetical protein
MFFLFVSRCAGRELSGNPSSAYEQKSHESSRTGGGLGPSHTSLGSLPLYGTLPAECWTKYHVWQTFMSHWYATPGPDDMS